MLKYVCINPGDLINDNSTSKNSYTTRACGIGSFEESMRFRAQFYTPCKQAVENHEETADLTEVYNIGAEDWAVKTKLDRLFEEVSRDGDVVKVRYRHSSTFK